MPKGRKRPRKTLDLAGKDSTRAEAAPAVPFKHVLWNAQACADYIGQSYSQFLKRTQYAPGFPERCPVPGQPRWRAQDVVEWATGSAS